MHCHCLLHIKTFWINRIETLMISRPHSSEGGNPTLNAQGFLTFRIFKIHLDFWGHYTLKAISFFFLPFCLIFGRFGTPYYKNYINTLQTQDIKAIVSVILLIFISNHNLNLEIPSIPNPMDLFNDVLELAVIRSRGLNFQEFGRQLVNTAII